ncbi:MAG: hypothetical protein OXE46_01330 [Chloroflexi bacterium]|nr:hypothetical protein [Chloroflexota bacterium]
MNILGVGAWEFVAILLIMLVFAGPKRMIHWSYVLGQHVAKFRKIWAETVDIVQKEFDDAGVDIQLPKEPPTRQNLNKTITAAAAPLTKPVQDSLDEVKKDIESVQEVSDALNQKQPKTKSKPQKTAATAKPATEAKTNQPAAPEPVKMGSWSGETTAAGSSNGSAPDLGSWSSGGEQDKA